MKANEAKPKKTALGKLDYCNFLKNQANNNT